MKKILTILLGLVICTKLSAQVVITSTESPKLTGKGMFGNTEKIAETVLPAFTRHLVAQLPDTNLYYRPSDPRNTDISLLREATTEVIGDNIIYRKKITGSGATSVKVYFDRLQLSANAKLYIYTPSGSVITGPVTSSENIGPDRVWGSNEFPGTAVIVEMMIPVKEKAENDIHISRIVLGIDPKQSPNSTNTSSFGNYGYSDFCADKNVMCSYGNDWVNERKAVCLIQFSEGNYDYFGSGALVANTCNLNEPYLLTAHHNTNGHNPNNWQYYFGWWSPLCTNYYTQTALLFNGATLKATHATTDFSLLKLYQTPAANADITYLGWSRSTTPASSTAGIHHPGGDQMKIALSTATATIDNIPGVSSSTAWKSVFGLGATQPGSSGSPLFDQDKRVIGQLWGGNSGESNCSLRFSLYGRFDLSWTGGGTDATRLSNWLDPSGTNNMTTNTTYVSNLYDASPGSYSISGPSQFCTSATYSIANLPPLATVTWFNYYSGTMSSSATGNTFSATRVSDGDVIIYARIDICGNVFTKSKSVRVGGAPIIVTSSPSGCNEVVFSVTGAETGATYNWSSTSNTILYNGVSTTATTTNNYISALAIEDAAIVNTTNTCSQAAFSGVYFFHPLHNRNIDGLLEIYPTCGDNVSVSVETSGNDTYYRWYINNILVKDGSYASTLCTCALEGLGAIQSGSNTMRVEVETICGATAISYGEFFMVCGSYGRAQSNVSLYPNPAKDQVTITLKQVNDKNSSAKLQSIKEIKITDKLGNIKRVMKYASTSNSVTVDISNLPIDIYYIEVFDGSNRTTLPLSIVK